MKLREMTDAMLGYAWNQLIEMAYPRSIWIDRVRDQIISGAMGEHAKSLLAKAVGLPDIWHAEVGRLMDQLTKFMDPNITKTKLNFDRVKALAEAMRDVRHDQHQITRARNQLSSRNPQKEDEIYRVRLDPEQVLLSMIKVFAPEFEELI